MSVPVLEAIADAIMKYEGWRPGSRSYRNRNPGNLRQAALEIGKDAGGYSIFPTFNRGYDALLFDLEEKVTGRNEHGLNLDSTLEDLFEVYAPSSDRNFPRLYAIFVASWLSHVYGRLVSALDPLRYIYEHIAGEELPSGVTSA